MTESSNIGEVFTPRTPSSPAPRVRTSPARTDLRAVYGPQSAYSYFRDISTVSRSQHRGDVAFRRALEAGGRVLPGLGPLPSALDGGEHDARGRLRAAAERRDLTSTPGAGGGLVPGGGPPVFISDAFALAARAKSVMADVLPTRPLPESGLKVTTPRFGSGSAVAIHVEATTVQETDPTTALATGPVGTIAGHNDISQQAVDMSNIDEAIAAELGNAYASQLDLQVVNGSGTAGQLLGLLNVPGISSVTYTSATPTAAENLANVGKLVSATASACGGAIDTLLLHPRRASYIRSKLGYAPEWPAGVVEVGAIPTNLGAGTNEDIVIALARAESPLFIETPTFRALIDPLSANLTVRFQIYGYSALLANRQPASIGKLSGTGLIAPTF
ncbi:MAG: phage major capsid protein [Actinomycetota bacterium]